MSTKEKEIAIIEINTHAEVLQNFLNILGSLPFTVNLFVIDKVWKRVKLKPGLISKPTVNIIKSEFEINSFFKRNIDRINCNDIVFINTLETHFYLFSKLKFTSPVICRVHNSNTFFNPSKNLYFRFSFYALKKDLTYIIKRQIINLDIIYRPRFIKNLVDYFCFPNEVTTNYALKKEYVKPDNIIEPLPLVYRNEGLIRQKKSIPKIVISIIGSIDKRRRNYDEVYEAFKKVIPRLENKVELYLLGKPFSAYGKNIINKFKNLETDYFKVNSYNSFVPFDEFKRVLEICDFQIIPVNRYAKYKIFREIYGLTKISGNVNDIILYDVPAIIPDYYPIEEELNPLITQYDSVNGLVKELKFWISEKKINNEVTKDLLLGYEFTNIKNKVHNIFSSLINNKIK